MSGFEPGDVVRVSHPDTGEPIEGTYLSMAEPDDLVEVDGKGVDTAWVELDDGETRRFALDGVRAVACEVLVADRPALERPLDQRDALLGARQPVEGEPLEQRAQVGLDHVGAERELGRDLLVRRRGRERPLLAERAAERDEDAALGVRDADRRGDRLRGQRG